MVGDRLQLGFGLFRLGSRIKAVVRPPSSIVILDQTIIDCFYFTELGVPAVQRQEIERRDVDVAHFRQFTKTLEQADHDYFGQYGNDQVHLKELCVFPNFRRRGAGKQLCRWGLDYASAKGWAATVLASPMGKLLYEGVGFELLGCFNVQVDDEPEKLTLWALTHVNKPQHQNLHG
jgi:GNAT superfamily N-acetyltransferase